MSLPVQSGPPLKANALLVTHRMRLFAVDAGSNAIPISMRFWNPLAVCSDVMTCPVPSVPSALIGKRSISPVSVPAYSRPSGPIVTLVNCLPCAVGRATCSNCTAPPPPPPPWVPVTKCDMNGRNGVPSVSCTPLVTWKV